MLERKTERQSWDLQSMQAAVDGVRSGQLTPSAAAKQYNIPRTTLRRQMQYERVKKGMCRKQDIPPEIEDSLVNHILLMESRGFGLTISKVEAIAYKLAVKKGLNVRFSQEKETAGKTWFYAFKKRHPNLSVRKPEALSLARAKGMNRMDVNKFFEMFEELLHQNSLFEDPARIHNADETGLQLNRPDKIVSMTGKRNVMRVTAKERGETVTVLSCVSATGVFMPPFVIFKGKNMKQEFKDNLPPGSVVYMSDSGYITVELFQNFLEHFVTHKTQGVKANLLILDGHSTHVSDPDVLQFAAENNIIMISIPPHTSHYIQPLDRSFFRSLKMHYYGACNSWIKQNPARNITKLQFGMLLSQAWGKACSVENGVSGFRACGLVPFNPGAIPKSAFAPSECFQQAENETPVERPCSASQTVESETPTGRFHCESQPAIEEPVAGTSGLRNCSVSRQNKRRVRFSSSDSSIEDSFSDGVPSKEDNASLLHQLCPVPRLIQKKSSTRCQKATILTSPKHIKKVKEKKDAKNAKEKKEKPKNSAKDRCLRKPKVNTEKKANEFSESACLYCHGLFSNDTMGEVWVCCVKCKSWCHEQCAEAANIARFVCMECTNAL